MQSAKRVLEKEKGFFSDHSKEEDTLHTDWDATEHAQIQYPSFVQILFPKAGEKGIDTLLYEKEVRDYSTRSSGTRKCVGKHHKKCSDKKICAQPFFLRERSK